MTTSTWLLWMVLSRLTGSPLGSAVAVLLFWLVVDRFTLGLLPDPLRFVGRLRRRWFLETAIERNPHDGRARLELGQLYVEAKKGQKAVEVLRPTFDNGADDVQSVFSMGEACLLAGYHEQGEKLLAHAEELDADFRVGEIHLVRGRSRLLRGDFAGAKTELEQLVKQRAGTVEGRVLLARAHAGLGDDATAALIKDEAWKEFTLAPRFQKRKERWWAYRANPARPATILFAVVLGLALFVQFAAPKINQWAHSQRDDGAYVDPGLDEPTE